VTALKDQAETCSTSPIVLSPSVADYGERPPR
jgi:hypothetical protein